MIENPIKVLIKVDEFGQVTQVTSSAFSSEEGYIAIDEGFGDRYVHAQNNYFEKPMRNNISGYTYKYVEGKIVENDAVLAQDIQDLPSETEKLRADVDFLLMLNGSFEV